jgi:hypothetical protein
VIRSVSFFPPTLLDLIQHLRRPGESTQVWHLGSAAHNAQHCATELQSFSEIEPEPAFQSARVSEQLHEALAATAVAHRAVAHSAIAAERRISPSSTERDGRIVCVTCLSQSAGCEGWICLSLWRV